LAVATRLLASTGFATTLPAVARGGECMATTFLCAAAGLAAATLLSLALGAAASILLPPGQANALPAIKAKGIKAYFIEGSNMRFEERRGVMTRPDFILRATASALEAG